MIEIINELVDFSLIQLTDKKSQIQKIKNIEDALNFKNKVIMIVKYL